MRIIKADAQLIGKDLSHYRLIEKVGRTCYKSENYISEGSDIRLIKSLVNNEHMAMLEHNRVHLFISESFLNNLKVDVREDFTYFNISRSKFTNDFVVSGSFRSFYDLFKRQGKKEVFTSTCLGRLMKHFILKYKEVFGCFDNILVRDFNCLEMIEIEYNQLADFLNPWDISKHMTHTIKFICDRGVSHEFARHEGLDIAMAQESTRYCNYNKDKFGSEITVIKPYLFKDAEDNNDSYPSDVYADWKASCEYAENKYMNLLDLGATPEWARSVLPNSLKTELIITATEDKWQHIVDLRYHGTTGAPHPQIKEVMGIAYDILVKHSDNRIK